MAPARTAGGRLVAAGVLLGFGLVLLASAAAYARDVETLRRAPELIWLFLCGVPSAGGATLPALLLGGAAAVGLAAAIVAHGRARTRRGRAAVVALTLLLPLASVALPPLVGGQQAREPAPPAETIVRGARLDPPRPLADFTLTSHTGAPLSLGDLRGRPALLFFGYIHCPDICPTTLVEFRRVSALLGERAGEVAFVFISVDGARDTPETLARYVGAFDPRFIGLTGDEATLRRIGADYGLFFEQRVIEGTSAAYLVDHTAAAYLVDPAGRLAVVYPFETPARVIAEDVRAMLGAEP
jgi:protein SCO1